MKAPNYSFDNLSSFAAEIGYSPTQLLDVAVDAWSFYHPNKPERKEDGELRQTFDVLAPLDSIQDRILDQILRLVQYPPYLHGGIEGRDYISDAYVHAGSCVIVGLDIQDFFPSIKSTLVTRLWGEFLGFSPELSDVLTRLVTYRGFLPQGASTSTHLANLVLWDSEPPVVQKLQLRDLTYTRYVDDINVSSRRKLSDQDIGDIITDVNRMLSAAGFRQKRKKKKVYRQGKRMIVHGLVVNNECPTMPKDKRNKIRAAVHDCMKKAKSDRSSPEYVELHDKTSGRVSELCRLHPEEGELLRSQLGAIRPVMDGHP